MAEPLPSLALPDVTPRSFTLFPSLPEEIRLMIWELALPGARVVELFMKPLKKTIIQWEQATGLEWPPFGTPQWREIEEARKDNDEGASKDAELADSGHAIPAEERKVARKNEGEVWGPYEELDSYGDVEMDVDSTPEDSEGNNYGPSPTPLNLSLPKAERVEELYPDWAFQHLMGYTTNCPPPTALFVNREAHMVASKHYRRAFHSLGSIPSTWFNFAIDILYLRCDTFLGFTSSDAFNLMIDEVNNFSPLLDVENLQRVKNLAILDDQHHTILEWELYTQFLALFGNIHRLELVIRRDSKDRAGRPLCVDAGTVDVENMRLYMGFESTAALDQEEPNIEFRLGVVSLKHENHEMMRFLAKNEGWHVPEEIQLRICLDPKFIESEPGEARLP